MESPAPLFNLAGGRPGQGMENAASKASSAFHALAKRLAQPNRMRSGVNWKRAYAPIKVDEEPRAALDQFVKRKVRGCISKTDIFYQVEKHGEQQFQCTLTLNAACFEGAQFISDLAPTPKDAEREAAKLALMNYIAEIEDMNTTAEEPPPKLHKLNRPPPMAQAIAEDMSMRLNFNNASSEVSPAIDVFADPDPTGLIVKWLQSHCGHCCSKMDVVYDVKKFDEGHRATLVLNCLDGERFVGSFGDTPKEARKRAAEQVILKYHDLIQASEVRAAREKAKKRPGKAAPSVMANRSLGCDLGLADLGGGAGLGRDGVPVAPGLPEPEPTEGPGFNPNTNLNNCNKAELNKLAMKILHGTLNKGDIVFEVGPVQGGFQCICRLPRLPMPDGTTGTYFVGDVTSHAKPAEQSGAGAAVAGLMEIPTFAVLANANKFERRKIVQGKLDITQTRFSKGKAKGK